MRVDPGGRAKSEEARRPKFSRHHLTPEFGSKAPTLVVMGRLLITSENQETDTSLEEYSLGRRRRRRRNTPKPLPRILSAAQVLGQNARTKLPNYSAGPVLAQRPRIYSNTIRTRLKPFDLELVLRLGARARRVGVPLPPGAILPELLSGIIAGVGLAWLFLSCQRGVFESRTADNDQGSLPATEQAISEHVAAFHRRLQGSQHR